MPAGYSFRPRLRPWALALVACAALVALGNWQMRRAQEKRVLGEEREQALRAPAVDVSSNAAADNALVGRRVAARGRLLAERTVYLDNKIHAGRPGYEVITPLEISGGSRCVLVNRGWIAGGPSRDVLPEVATPA